MVLRAYSSLPTRISVFSSSCTTAASTFSRGRPGRAQIRAGAPPDRRQRLRERDHAVGTWSRRGPRASAGDSDTASARGRRGRSPGGGRADPGEIQTSVHAGGITSERMRCRSALFRMTFLSGPTYRKAGAVPNPLDSRHGVGGVAQAGRAGESSGSGRVVSHSGRCCCGRISLPPSRYASHDLPCMPIHAGVSLAPSERIRTTAADDDGKAALPLSPMQLAEMARRPGASQCPGCPSGGPAHRTCDPAGVPSRVRSAGRTTHRAAAKARHTPLLDESSASSDPGGSRASA